MIIAASMMPIDGMLRIEALPLNFGSMISAQVVDIATDDFRSNAERIGIVDRRHHG